MSKLVIEIDLKGRNTFGDALELFTAMLKRINEAHDVVNIRLPAEPAQHPAYIPGRNTAVLFEAGADLGNPRDIAVRVGVVPGPFDTSIWQEERADTSTLRELS